MNNYHENESTSNENKRVYTNNRRYAKRKKQKGSLVVLLLSLVVVLGIGVFFVFQIVGKNELVGTWKYDQYTQYEFNKDGTGCLCVDDVHYEYKYSVKGDKLILDFVKDVVSDCDYKFEVKDNSLTLIGGEGTDRGKYFLNKISKK